MHYAMDRFLFFIINLILIYLPPVRLIFSESDKKL